MVETKNKLEKLATDVMAFGADLFNRMGPDKIMPTWIAQSHGDDAWDIGGTPWRDDTEKEIYVAIIKEHYAEIKAVRYAFLSETWIISRKIDEDDGVRPSEAADRRETLVVMAEDYENSILLQREIVRPPGGKPYLKEVETVRATKADTSGIMADMLPKAEEGAALQ